MRAHDGEPHEQYLLGMMYEHGRGVARDHGQAAEWYLKSAEQGYASAQFALGRQYCGDGELPANWTEAARWMLKAADQGQKPAAQYFMGLSYEVGDGVPKDLVEAYKWLSLCMFLSAPTNYGHSSRRDANRRRALLQTKMTDDQVARATELAHQWVQERMTPAQIANVMRWPGNEIWSKARSDPA